MPKLVFFVACENVLIAEDSKNASLISIFDALTVPVPPPELKDAQALIQWSLVSYWIKKPEDEGKKFEQHTKLVSPNGSITAESNIEFVLTTRSHRNNVRVNGFPVIPPGEYKAILSIRELGQSEWLDIADYSIFVTNQ
jgi:hypothetical protein